MGLNVTIMREKKRFYIEIRTSEELPEREGQYFTDLGEAVFNIKDEGWDGTDYTVNWWLKELPFEDLMIGFAEWCEGNYKKEIKGWIEIMPDKVVYYTTTELLNIYCKLKGINIFI